MHRDNSQPERICTIETIQPQRLDAALALLLPSLGVRGRRRAVEQGCVLLNGNCVRRAGTLVRQGDVIAIAASQEMVTQDEQPQLIRQEDDFLFFYKPAGWHTVMLPGSQNLSLESLLPSLGGASATLLQRLDCPTSGIVCAARTNAAMDFFRQQEQTCAVEKRYLALVLGALTTPQVVRRAVNMDGGSRVRLHDEESADPSRWTEFFPLADISAQVQERLAVCVRQADLLHSAERVITLVGCRIHRGARHQIRVHAAALKHPLWGDLRYTAGEKFVASSKEVFFLHHGGLSFARYNCHCMPRWITLLDAQTRCLAEDWLRGNKMLSHGN